MEPMFGHLLKQWEFTVLMYPYVIRDISRSIWNTSWDEPGVFPNPWGNRSLECSQIRQLALPHLGKWQNIWNLFVKFFFARKAPDVAILQITGTFFNSGAGCRSSGMNDGGDLSQFLECIYTMHFFIDIHIYIHMHLIYVERGRKKTYIESNSWCVVCRSKIRIPSKDCLKLVTGPVRNDNAFSRVPWKIYDWLEPPKLHTSACLQVNLNQW